VAYFTGTLRNRKNKDEMSTVDPDFYATRFKLFLESVVSCPDGDKTTPTTPSQRSLRATASMPAFYKGGVPIFKKRGTPFREDGDQTSSPEPEPTEDNNSKTLPNEIHSVTPPPKERSKTNGEFRRRISDAWKKQTDLFLRRSPNERKEKSSESVEKSEDESEEPSSPKVARRPTKFNRPKLRKTVTDESNNKGESEIKEQTTEELSDSKHHKKEKKKQK